MNIDYKTGDMLESDIFHVVQGCNAKGVCGSGVCKTIRERYPKNFEVYHRTYVEQGNRLRLGQVIWVDCGDHIIGNMISQDNYGRDAVNGVVYADYDAIERGIELIDARFEGYRYFAEVLAAGTTDIGLQKVAFPLIGAGLAGGSWKRISSIIERRAKNFQPVVFLFDGKMPDS